MSEQINVALTAKGLATDDVEIVRLDYGLRLYIIKKLNKPILLTAADGENFVDEVVEVIRFRRPLISRLFRTRRCTGSLRVRKIGSDGASRAVYFINAHPIFGYRFSWDNEEGLWDTRWDEKSFTEKLFSLR